MTYFSIHNHSEYSNLKLVDALCRPREMLEYANEIGLAGISLSDHESLSGNVKILQEYKKMKKSGELNDDFILALGNEIYLPKEDSLEELKENYANREPDTQFYHFLLTSISSEGHRQLRELSSLAWNNMFQTGFVQRAPTFKKDMKRIINGGHIVATSACFPKGTLVETKEGLKTIETISKGEEVLTHRGRWKEVVKPTTRLYKGNKVTVKNIGSSFNITSTANHKFLTIPHWDSKTVRLSEHSIDEEYYNELIHSHNSPSKNRKQMMKRNAIISEPRWIEAQDLSNIQCLLTPIDELVDRTERLFLTKYHQEESKYKLPNSLKITPRFMEILGFYAAEGSLNTHSKNSIAFSTHSQKTDLIEMVTSFFKEELNMNPRVYNKKDSLGADITIGSIEVYEMFSDLFKAGAHNKGLPEFAKYLDPYLQSYFIKGLFLGDGHTRFPKRNNVSFSTTSKQLVSDVVHVLHRLGINPAVNTNPASLRGGVQRKEWYSTEINSKLAVALHKFIWEDEKLTITTEMKRSRDIPYVYNNIKYMKHRISEVKKSKIDERVFCLSVEGDHSFIAEGVTVHNCLGGFVPQMILRWLEQEEVGNDELTTYYKKEIHEFITFCIGVFGQDKFFLEIQPSENEEQHIVNRKLIELSKVYDIDYIAATDSHYIKKSDRYAHKVYLQSQQGDREVDAFYDSTHFFSEDEIKEALSSHLSEDEIQTSLDNTMKIYDMIEEYDLFQETIIPHAHIESFELNHTFKPAYDKFEYIEKFAYSEHEIDRYYLYLIEEGFKEQTPTNTLSREHFYEIMDRINTEMKELWIISDRLGDRMSNYYVLVSQIVNLIWTKGDSITGISRGSAAGYLTSMYLGIIQINPLDYDLPHFRHLTAERISLPDIDLDSEQSKRAQILQALKDEYGEDRVLNIATFSTEGARSALLSACRGMGIDVDEASYLTNLIPSERGKTRSLAECFYGDGDKLEPVTELVNAVNKHEGLMEIATKIDGIIKNKSVHASGVFVYNSSMTDHNAMMKSSSGQSITQFDMKDSEGYLGNLKIDMLTVQNIDKIRTTMDLLVEDGYMDWQGSLRETYDKYLHPRVLEYDDSEMWEKVAENSIPDLFQFDTAVGLQCAQKIKPTSVTELSKANNLMRLMGEGIQPVDKYVLHRDNPEVWMEEMKRYNLTDDEIKIVKDHLEESSGVSDSQEEIMLLSMDKRISNFTIPEADNLRKAVAKIDMEVLTEVKELFFEKGLKNV